MSNKIVVDDPPKIAGRYTKHYGKINTRDTASRGDQTRIFVSLGKKDGYRAKEIADYFSELLHIPGRMIDDIDVAQQFSLLSLPTSSAKKVVEMSVDDPPKIAGRYTCTLL